MYLCFFFHFCLCLQVKLSDFGFCAQVSKEVQRRKSLVASHAHAQSLGECDVTPVYKKKFSLVCGLNIV